MVEVFTIGGGEYIVNVFNAVAAWTGGGGYRALLRVVMVLGFIYALMAVAFTMNVRAWMNWFLGSSLIYGCLMVPTVTVKVTDRINPSLAPAVVANVPLGLGAMASFTSQVGDWLTRTAETVFVMPNELNYSTNGMIYGARLFDMTRNFQIRDAEFATNLQMHFKNCVFGDILLHRKSLTVLSQSKDLWADLGPGSEARAQPWIEYDAGGGMTNNIVTCKAAYDLLNVKWKSMIEAATDLWGKEAYNRLSTAQAAAKLKQDIPIVASAFTGSSGDYTSTMRQMTAINAFMQARDGMAGGPGAASIDTFATTRADIQARNTYNSIAQQAMTWVPILNIVLTVVFYAMFPVIFPLFLMPQTGVSALKGYLTGFFYLASWGPLYVILHMICMSRGMSAAKGVAEGGVSLGTFAGIGAVNAETATIAGFMLMSVPFMAAALSKGAMGISGHSMAMLNPAQNAAEAAAVEQTTGNYSYGNVSFANTTDNMRQSSQWSTAPTMTDGHGSYGYRTESGTMFTSHDNGRMVMNADPSISKLPFAVTRSSGEMAAASQNASEAARIAKSNTQGSSEDVTFTLGSGSSFTTALANGSGFDSRSTVLSGSDIQQYGNTDRTAGTGLSILQDGSDRLSNGARAGQQFEFNRNMTAEGTARWGGGSGSGQGSGSGGWVSKLLPDLGFSLSAGGRGNWNDTYGSSQSRDLATGTVNSEDLKSNIGLGSGTRYSVNDGTSLANGRFASSVLTNTSSNTTSQQLDRNWRVTSARNELQEISDSLNRDISYSQSHGMQMSENLSTKLQEWYGTERARHPNMGLPELHDQYTTPAQDMARNAAVGRFMSERNDAVRERIGELEKVIQTNGLADIAPLAPATRASVTGRYHGGGVGAPHTVSVAAPDRSAAIAGVTGVTDAVRDVRADLKPGVRNATGASLEQPKDVSVLDVLNPFSSSGRRQPPKP